MKSSFREEIMDVDPVESFIERPHVERDLTKGRIVVAVVAVLLLGLSLFGLNLLVNSYMNGESTTVQKFVMAIGLFSIPLLLLGVLLGGGARYIDRLHLAISYQDRLNKLQTRLNYSEDLLRLVSNHQAGVIAIFDRQNRFWFVNQSAVNSIGKTAMEIIGKPASRVLGVDKARQLEVRLAEARASKSPIEKVDQIIDGHGKTSFIQSRYVAIAEFPELLDGVLVSEEDLTTLIVERERRERMFRQVIDTLVAVVDRRDPYAAGHSARVGQLARAIGEEMGLDKPFVETADIAGSLMNFGKVLVSRQILTKTTALTPEELQRVRDSILVSSDILSIIGFDGPVVPTLRQVLERFDGTGVPEGLKGEDILVTARIVSVANAFVVFVSPRAHRDGLSFPEALKAMMKEAGKAYDQRVVIALSNYIENRPNKLDWLMATKQK